MYDVPRRKELRDRCAEPWKRKGAAVSGFPSLPRLPVGAQGPPCRLEFVVTILLCGKRPNLKESASTSQMLKMHSHLILEIPSLQSSHHPPVVLPVGT